MPKVSVILPNYNHSKYLPERLDSILGQSFSDFEVIVLDDASSDDSLEVINSYSADKRINQVIKNSQNSGSTFFQWQKGIELAKGEFIWIAESDDIAEHDFLEVLLGLMDSNVGLAYCASLWIDENSKVIHEPDHEKEDATWSGNQLISGEMLTGNLIYNASSAVFRKELISKVDFNKISTFKYAGDWLFWVQLMKDTQVVRTGKRLNHFRRHTGNVSFKAEENGLQFKEGLRVLEYIFSSTRLPFLKKREIWLRWAKKFSNSSVKSSKELLRELPWEMRTYVKFFK